MENLLTLSFHQYGCRVVQKMISIFSTQTAADIVKVRLDWLQLHIHTDCFVKLHQSSRLGRLRTVAFALVCPSLNYLILFVFQRNGEIASRKFRIFRFCNFSQNCRMFPVIDVCILLSQLHWSLSLVAVRRKGIWK